MTPVYKILVSVCVCVCVPKAVSFIRKSIKYFQLFSGVEDQRPPLGYAELDIDIET